MYHYPEALPIHPASRALTHRVLVVGSSFPATRHLLECLRQAALHSVYVHCADWETVKDLGAADNISARWCDESTSDQLDMRSLPVVSNPCLETVAGTVNLGSMRLNCGGPTEVLASLEVSTWAFAGWKGGACCPAIEKHLRRTFLPRKDCVDMWLR